LGTYTNENPTPLDPAGWELTFFDGFDGAYLDRAAWPIVFHGSTYWNGAFEWRQENVVVWDGELTANSIASPDGWTSGGLNMGWNGQIYGRWEVRARLDEGKGTSAAILLWPTDGEYPPEIDLLESPDPERHLTSMTVHSEGQHEGHQVLSDASEWHTYAVDWLPDRITFYIDGVEAWTTTNRIPSEPMALGFMGFVASSEDEWFGGAPDASTPGVVGLHVDWVRIWTPEELYPGEAPAALYGDAASGWGAAPDTVRTGVRSLGEDRFAGNWNGGEWGSVAGVRVDAGTSWTPGTALEQLYANYEQVALDLRAAPGAMTLDVIGAATGTVRLGRGHDNVVWLAHADEDSPLSRPDIRTGAGNDTITVTTPSEDWIAMPFGWGGRWDGSYDGRTTFATVLGEAGRDHIEAEGHLRVKAIGGSGNDTVIGGAGADVIRGGPGQDDLTGGAARDRFIYAAGEGGDIIRDFTPRIDKLYLAATDPSQVSTTATADGLAVFRGEEQMAVLVGVTALHSSDILFG
jgi:hypothetical protein